MWALLAFTAFLKFSFTYLVGFRHLFSYVQLIVIVALCLNAANVIGYFRCSKDEKTRLTSLAGAVSQTLLQKAMTSALGYATSPAAPAGPTRAGV